MAQKASLWQKSTNIAWTDIQRDHAQLTPSRNIKNRETTNNMHLYQKSGEKGIMELALKDHHSKAS